MPIGRPGVPDSRRPRRALNFIARDVLNDDSEAMRPVRHGARIERDCQGAAERTRHDRRIRLGATSPGCGAALDGRVVDEQRRTRDPSARILGIDRDGLDAFVVAE